MDSNSTYIVLGATGGIGAELCRRLRASGCNVVGAGRRPDQVQALAETCDIHPMTIDATSLAEVSAGFAQVEQTFGRVDGIANCVGSAIFKPAHLTTELEWHSMLAANLTTAFATVHAGAKVLMNAGGSIVLVSSVAARIGIANHEAVAAAKAGVVGLTLAAAASYAARGIRVNCVAPGLVRTPLSERWTANPAALQASAALHPLGRIGEPGDVAAAIAWLLDREQSWITGQVLGVDGGLAALQTRPASAVRR